MQNETKDGIICDYCRKQYKNDFVYYSYDFVSYNVNNGMQNRSSEYEFTADLCDKCNKLFLDRVKANYIPPSKIFKCEVSGNQIKQQNFIYHKAMVSKVSIGLDSGLFDVQKEFVEINFCDEAFKAFKEHISLLKKVDVDSNWSTSPS